MPRSRGGSGVLAGGEGEGVMRPTISRRHAELVPASIAPRAQVSEFEAASAVCLLNASVQTEGSILKRVQDDGVLEVFG